MYRTARYFSTAAVLIILLVLSAGISLTLGAADISARMVGNILISRIIPALESPQVRQTHIHIIMYLRLPRVLTALVVGAALGISGTVFQAVFRNPMADPYIIGISSGAAFGAAIGLVTGMSAFFSLRWGIPLFAFIGGIGATTVIYLLGGRGRSATTLLLAGVAMNFLLSSLMSLMLYFNRDSLESVVYWNMGSLAASGWEDVSVMAPIILVGGAALLLFQRELNAMTLGDESALSLGVSIRKIRIGMLGLATVVTSASVAVSGTIGFVGLITPHVMRILTGPNHKTLLPYSAAAGALFLTVSDALARSIVPPAEIPVGIITAIAGAPYFLYLLKHRFREAV